MVLQLHPPRWLKPAASAAELACPPAQDAWMEIAAVRSTIARDLIGGVSGLFRSSVNLFVLGPPLSTTWRRLA